MESQAPASESRDVWLERVFSLTSVVPVGAFVLFHVADYARVLFGTFEIGARRSPPPWLLAAEAVFVWLPFLAHAVLGVAFWRKRRAEPAPDASSRALLGVHRLCGVVVAVFLVDHFVRFRLPIVRGERFPADAVQHLAAELSRTPGGFPWIAALQLLGVIAASFHLAFGLRRIAARFPALAGRRSARALSLGVGLAVLFAGLFSLLYLATG